MLSTGDVSAEPRPAQATLPTSPGFCGAARASVPLARREGRVRTFGPIARMVLQRSLGHWRLLSTLITGIVLSAALMACVALYSDSIRDLGLISELKKRLPIGR